MESIDKITPEISIHALREEGDQAGPFTAVSVKDFYPRPPRGGRRYKIITMQPSLLFLSTPSARRATCSGATLSTGQANFYPRPPRGGRRQSQPVRRSAGYFYPRPPRGGRLQDFITARRSEDFYPRPPRGGRREQHQNHPATAPISIHALREEGDKSIVE